MISKLAFETLQHIFSFIEDTNTLYSIIRVNRSWCVNGIKYLWRNPFTDDIQNVDKHTKILPVFIPILRKDKILEWKNRGDCMNETMLLTKFVYPSIITHLDYDNLFRIISAYYKMNKEDVESFVDFMENQFNVLFNLPQQTAESSSLTNNEDDFGLRKILFVTSIILTTLGIGRANIKWLKINISRIKKRYDVIMKIEDILCDFLKFGKDSVVNLKYLEYGKLAYKLPILDILSASCKQIETINIQEKFFQLIRNPIVNLLKNQIKLKDLQLIGSNHSMRLNYDETIFEMISTLEIYAQSLKIITLSGMYVNNDEAFKFFGKCKNLECMNLENLCISFKNFEWISSMEFPKLWSLTLLNVYCDNELNGQPNPLQGIFQNKTLTPNLKVLSLLCVCINHDILISIGENYRNLRLFSTQITADGDIPYLFTILNNSPKLEELHLVIPQERSSDVNNRFIGDLAKNLPCRINALQFSNIIRNIDEYRSFLENCEVKLKYFHLNFFVSSYNTREFKRYIRRWSNEKGKVILNYYITSDKFYVLWK
ncbi:9061_t:CDS:2 [Funneliformis geosporum]|uniref:10282_t:CDS:1 n=1 Tax=Funneliformis geosporum TaxID=1117311 RepID=A0A9W4SAD3_9GLOM|nr:10282_t:CDS:2 [Funneliformis geosporum]CAI2161513.1 9061_t:CDS:2 [Funneliformis geosporum]